MQFNGDSNNLDLYHEALWWAGQGTDTTQFTVAQFTRSANFGMDRVISLIFKSDQKWQFDDSNNTDLPIATANLVNGQQDYSFAVTQLKVWKVRIKDSGGNWVTLDPVDRRDLSDSQLTESNGTPRRYDKLGNSIFLYPASDYSSTGGMEVQFQRGASYFIPTDTTKTPGFASQFHRLIAFYGARDYLAINGVTNQWKIVDNEITKMENDLLDYYSSRNPDEHQRLATAKEDYGEQALGTQGRGISDPYKFYA